MERLAKRVDGIAVLESWAIDKDPVSIIQMLCNRLAAYEDTGLEPEDIKKHEAAYNECLTSTYGPFKQKIIQWLQAEQAGRLVVLPKPSDTDVYIVYYDECGAGGMCLDYPYCDDCKEHTPKIREAKLNCTMVNSIGKTVFLTREEAEAALAKKGDSEQ